MDSKTFNRNWIAKVDHDELHTLLGYGSLVTLLDDCAEKVLKRLSCCDAEKFVVRPFHGSVITFYAR